MSAELFAPPEPLRFELQAGENAAPYCAVFGLALSGAQDLLRSFNFAHPKEPEAEHRERVQRVPMVAVAVGLFAAAGLVLAYVPIRSRSQRIDELNAQIVRVNVDLKQREELNRQLSDLRDWQSRSVTWLDTLRQIRSRYIPLTKTRISHGSISTPIRGS